MQINRTLLPAFAALVLAAPLAAHAATDSKTFPISAQNASGEKGTVTLTSAGADKTTVVVELTGAPSAAQPAHIHTGTCAKLDPAPKYPLKSLAGGKSTTTVDASLASLTAGGFAVNVHKSADDLKDYVACGDLTTEAMKPAPASSSM
jgi:Cu/Zn superoxide dismutase